MDLHINLTSVSMIWYDNLSATNPIFHSCTKHVEVNYHFVRDKIVKKDIYICFIPYKDQLVDVLTMPLPIDSSIYFRFKLRVESPPSA
jgi:hypothetical protein